MVDSRWRVLKVTPGWNSLSHRTITHTCRKGAILQSVELLKYEKKQNQDNYNTVITIRNIN